MSSLKLIDDIRDYAYNSFTGITTAKSVGSPEDVTTPTDPEVKIVPTDAPYEFILDYIPVLYQPTSKTIIYDRDAAANLVEISSGALAAGQFKINYTEGQGQGQIAFHDTAKGHTVEINYWQIGSIFQKQVLDVLKRTGKTIADNSGTDYAYISKGFDVVFSQGTGQTFSTDKAFVTNMKVTGREGGPEFANIDIEQMTNQAINSGSITADGSTVNYLYLYWRSLYGWELRVASSQQTGSNVLPLVTFISSAGYIFSDIKPEWDYRKQEYSNINTLLADKTIKGGGYLRNTHTVDQYWKMDCQNHLGVFEITVIERASSALTKTIYLINTEAKIIERTIYNTDSDNAELSGQISHEIQLYLDTLYTDVIPYIVINSATQTKGLWISGRVMTNKDELPNNFTHDNGSNNFMAVECSFKKVNTESIAFSAPAGYSDDTSNYQIFNEVRQHSISEFSAASFSGLFYNNKKQTSSASWFNGASRRHLICTLNNTDIANCTIDIDTHRISSSPNNQSYSIRYIIRNDSAGANTVKVSTLIQGTTVESAVLPKLRIYANDTTYIKRIFIDSSSAGMHCNIKISILEGGELNNSNEDFPTTGWTKIWDYDTDSAVGEMVVGNDARIKKDLYVENDAIITGDAAAENIAAVSEVSCNNLQTALLEINANAQITYGATGSPEQAGYASSIPENTIFDAVNDILDNVTANTARRYFGNGTIVHDGIRLFVNSIIKYSATEVRFYGYNDAAGGLNFVSVVDGNADTVDYYAVTVLPLRVSTF